MSAKTSKPGELNRKLKLGVKSAQLLSSLLWRTRAPGAGDDARMTVPIDAL